MLIYEPLFYNFNPSSQAYSVLHFLIFPVFKEKTIFTYFFIYILAVMIEVFSGVGPVKEQT